MHVQVSGQLLAGFFREASAAHGIEPVREALATRSQGVAKALAQVVAGGWYPVLWLALVDEAIIDVSGRPEAVRELARATSDLAFRRLARDASVSPRLLRPHEVLGRSVALLPSSFEGLSCRLVDRGEAHQHRRYDAATPIPAVVWDHFRGGLHGVVEATGADDVVVTDVHGGGDAPFLELRVSWTPTPRESMVPR